MINRRSLLSGAVGSAATAALFSRSAGAAIAGYDLVVKGGRVIDPSRGLDAVRDVAIGNGRIAAVGQNIPAGAAEVVDASGKLVVPGLIDIHTHTARTSDGPGLVLKDGVTGWIDAGSQGADHIEDTIAVAKSAPQQARVLINIGRAGILPEGDTMDLNRADVAAARNAVGRNREMIAGVKARLSRDVAGQNDYEVLRRAQQVATEFNLPVMIHMGQTITPLGKLVALLKPGDVVTHMYAPPPNSIIDENGKLLPEVVAARRRGVWFDVGNGQTGHMRWDTVDAIVKQNFSPDTFSTDWNVNAHMTGVVDFPNCMSKFLMLGMPLDQVIARATVNAARIFPVFRGRGTLAPGAPADVAILELRNGDFEFLDNFDNRRVGHQRLFPGTTILAGKRVTA